MRAFTLEKAVYTGKTPNWKCPATHVAVARLTLELYSSRWATAPLAESKRRRWHLLPGFSFAVLFLIALLASSTVVVTLGYLGGRAMRITEWRSYSSGVQPQQWPKFSGR